MNNKYKLYIKNMEDKSSTHVNLESAVNLMKTEMKKKSSNLILTIENDIHTCGLIRYLNDELVLIPFGTYAPVVAYIWRKIEGIKIKNEFAHNMFSFK